MNVGGLASTSGFLAKRGGRLGSNADCLASHQMGPLQTSPAGVGAPDLSYYGFRFANRHRVAHTCHKTSLEGERATAYARAHDLKRVNLRPAVEKRAGRGNNNAAMITTATAEYHGESGDPPAPHARSTRRARVRADPNSHPETALSSARTGCTRCIALQCRAG